MSDESSPSDGDRTDPAPDQRAESELEGGPARTPDVGVSETWLVRIAVAVAALLLLYSVLIAQQLLLWVGIVAPFVLLYLFWRFVRAHERIAAARERRARE